MKRFRFSLRSLMLAVFCIAAGWGVWWRWNPWVYERDLPAPADDIKSIAISPDSRNLITVCTYDKYAYIWDLASGREIGKLGQPQSASNKRFETPGVLEAGYSRDGALIYTYHERLLRIWNAVSLDVRCEIGGLPPRYRVEFSTDGKSILTVEENLIRVWSTAEGELQSTIPVNGKLTRARYLSDRTIIAVSERGLWGGQGSEVLIAKTDAAVTRVAVPQDLRIKDVSPEGSVMVAYQSPQRALTSNKRNPFITYADRGTTVLLAVNGSTIERQPLADIPVEEAQFLADGSQILLRHSNTLRLWDLKARKPTCVLNTVGTAELPAPDSRSLAVVDPEKVCVRSTNGEVLARTKPGANRIRCIEYSPDGNRIVAAPSKYAHLVPAPPGTVVGDSLDSGILAAVGTRSCADVEPG